jgi:hypothetical protein
MSTYGLQRSAKRVVPLALVALLASATAATASHRLIGPNSIAGARLAHLLADYVRVFGPVRFTTRLPHGLKRLSFGDGEVHVFLASSTGKAVGILTSDKDFKTRDGVGPCSSVQALKAAYGNRLSSVRLASAHGIAAYRMGSLAFVVSGDRIGNVMLASSRLPLSIGLNAAQCGVGEEE